MGVRVTQISIFVGTRPLGRASYREQKLKALFRLPGIERPLLVALTSRFAARKPHHRRLECTSTGTVTGMDLIRGVPRRQSRPG